jgi:hypothetical protein
MLIKNYPKWYVQALKNKSFYESEKYRTLIQDGINEYNAALDSKDQAAIEKWKDYILKWLEKKETNRFMLMQYAG